MRTEIKWAIIATIVLFVWLLLEKLLGLHAPEKLATWMIVDFIASILIFIAIYYMTTRDKRDVELGGVMSWKQGFWAAAVMTLIFIPLSSLVVYIFIKFVSPELPGSLTSYAKSTKDAISTFMSSHVTSSIVGGLLFSLIFPVFTKRAA
ncbi:MAG: DUF4199 domain-containing protein [Bacteroidota bacterium]